MASRRDVQLTIAADLPSAVVAGLGYRSAAEAVADTRGRLVRAIPHRRTFATEVFGTTVYRKVRVGRARDAVHEWSMLAQLEALGIRVPRRAFLARDGGRSAIGTLAVAGRSVFELLRPQPPGARAQRFLVECVAPMVARLHRAGLFHRDLYWHHVFAETLDPSASPPVLIDVERTFRPRWRSRRWLVKDLAGLLSSWPRGPAPVCALRFLRAYSGGRLPAGWKRLARDVIRKAARIRAHVPRYGAPAAGDRRSIHAGE